MDKRKVAQELVKLARSLMSGKVRMKGGKVDRKATESLRKMKLRAKNSGDLSSAIVSAGYYAKKHGDLVYVYPGNSYGHAVWRATLKESDALNPINNTGRAMYTVDPELTVMFYETDR